jgi:hypothetical protein
MQELLNNFLRCNNLQDKLLATETSYKGPGNLSFEGPWQFPIMAATGGNGVSACIMHPGQIFVPVLLYWIGGKGTVV